MSGYALLDCGDGRRLERLGGIVVDRPAPAARFAPGLSAAAWREAALVFTRDTGWQGEAPVGWRESFAGVTMRLRPAAAGQVGVFPEHLAVAESLAGALRDTLPRARVLNLFAHTGLATLYLAAAGAAGVVHVDAAPAAVRTGKENAALSGLDAAPVRWLVDDALAFCSRERRRGNRYDAILADPPAYGRAGKREWKLERDLPVLAEALAGLLLPGGLAFLTCHSEGWDEARLEAVAAGAGLSVCSVRALRLEAESGTGLPSGWVLKARG